MLLYFKCCIKIQKEDTIIKPNILCQLSENKNTNLEKDKAFNSYLCPTLQLLRNQKYFIGNLPNCYFPKVIFCKKITYQ